MIGVYIKDIVWSYCLYVCKHSILLYFLINHIPINVTVWRLTLASLTATRQKEQLACQNDMGLLRIRNQRMRTGGVLSHTTLWHSHLFFTLSWLVSCSWFRLATLLKAADNKLMLACIVWSAKLNSTFSNSSRRLSGHGNDGVPNQQEQNDVFSHDHGGPSYENSTAVEEIYLPPQLGNSKWQTKRGKPYTVGLFEIENHIYSPWADTARPQVVSDDMQFLEFRWKLKLEHTQWKDILPCL